MKLKLLTLSLFFIVSLFISSLHNMQHIEAHENCQLCVINETLDIADELILNEFTCCLKYNYQVSTQVVSYKSFTHQNYFANAPPLFS